MPKRRTQPKRGNPGMPHCVAKRYKLPRWVVREIRKVAPAYGSQGRALQVATELLIRMKKAIRVRHQGDKTLVGMTYKLTPRTVQLIEDLCDQYRTRGTVLAACAKVLAK
jgi:hypothetical protein